VEHFALVVYNGMPRGPDELQTSQMISKINGRRAKKRGAHRKSVEEMMMIMIAL
jgi:hypothetical protein